MKKIRIGDAYRRPILKPNICVVCGKHPIQYVEQLMFGGLLVGKCEEHVNYCMILRKGDEQKGEAPLIYEAININK